MLLQKQSLTHKLIVLIAAFCATTLFAKTEHRANTTDVKQAVLEACENYQKGKNVSPDNRCKAYIDGFIDASILAQSATFGSGTPTQSDRSSIVKRALKYRIGVVDIKGTTVNYDFCIPEDVKLFDLKANVINSLDIAVLNQVPLKLEVLSTLKRLYPC